jgi:hypothetical protein
VVLDDELEVAAADAEVEVVQLLGVHAPHERGGDGARDPDLGALGDVGQRRVVLVRRGERRDAEQVVLAEGDRLDAGLLLQQRELVGGGGDDVAVAAGEVRELVPGGRGHDPHVVLLLVLHDDPVVVHVVPHGIWREREADDRSTALGRPAAVVTAAGGQRAAHGGQRSTGRGRAQELAPVAWLVERAVER